MNAPREANLQPLVLCEARGAVATVTLNRPAQYNSLQKAMLEELQQMFDAIALDESVRVVVLRASGKAFCAGHDLKEMLANREYNFCVDLFKQCSRMMMSIARMPQPVIAKVEGIATAAGCQLVAMADLAVCSENAKFATSGIHVGLFCATPGVAVSRNMHRKQALEMLLTGEFIDAKTALKFGLVNRVAPSHLLDVELNRLVDGIVSFPREVIALGKRLFYEQLELPIEMAYERASDVMASNMMLDDTAEGIEAFISKRAPRWSHRKK